MKVSSFKKPYLGVSCMNRYGLRAIELYVNWSSRVMLLLLTTLSLVLSGGTQGAPAGVGSPAILRIMALRHNVTDLIPLYVISDGVVSFDDELFAGLIGPKQSQCRQGELLLESGLSITCGHNVCRDSSVAPELRIRDNKGVVNVQRPHSILFHGKQYAFEEVSIRSPSESQVNLELSERRTIENQLTRVKKEVASILQQPLRGSRKSGRVWIKDIYVLAMIGGTKGSVDRYLMYALASSTVLDGIETEYAALGIAAPGGKTRVLEINLAKYILILDRVTGASGLPGIDTAVAYSAARAAGDNPSLTVYVVDERHNIFKSARRCADYGR